MIFSLIYTSPQGDQIDLANNSNFILTGIDGMTNAAVDISTDSIALADGDFITNTRTQQRAITMYFKINPGVNVEVAKRSILSVIKPKQTGKLSYIHNDRYLEISGAIETIEMPRFTDNVVMQITMYCSYPYWQDATEIVQDLSEIIAIHHFELIITDDNPIVFGRYNNTLTRDFYNDGDATTGMVITIIATGDVTNPRIEKTDGTFFGLQTSLSQNDEVIINTMRGQKSVIKNNVNIIASVEAGSTWVQLSPGQNIFTLAATSNPEHMVLYMSYKRSFV